MKPCPPILLFAFLTFGLGTGSPPPLQSAPEPDAADQRTMQTLDNTRKLTTGDTLSFRVIEDRDPQRILSVRASGDVPFPYIGNVQAKGKTCRELAQEVKKLLEVDYYHKATVLIGLYHQTHTSNTVYVVGQVQRPGPVTLPENERFTVSKAILAAGGFQKFANKRVRVIRKTGPNAKDTEEIRVNVADVLERGRLESDAEVVPGDMVIVPERLINF